MKFSYEKQTQPDLRPQDLALHIFPRNKNGTLCCMHTLKGDGDENLASQSKLTVAEDSIQWGEDIDQELKSF